VPGATLFQIIVGLVGSLACTLCALAYFRRVVLPRPPIGTFNARDLTVLAVFIVTLPVLYVSVPPGVLTGFLVVTFFSALMIALRPLVAARRLLVVVPLALTVNLVITRSMSGVEGGLQLYWVSTTVIVVIAAVGVANLYVQGGLGLRQIAWFTVFLGIYDIFFTRVIPLTPELAVALQGRPLDPSLGFAAWGYNANVGLGDLLVFCLYATAAYRGFGRRGALASLLIIAVFGAIAPSVTPLLVPGLFGSTAAAFVPIMTLFGPAAFVCYLWLSRSSPERPLRVWLAERAAAPARAVLERRARFGSAVPAGAIAALVVATLLLSGDATPTTAAAPPPDAPTAGRTCETAVSPVRVTMRNVRFGPAHVTAKMGQTITWTNGDRVPHDIVATNGATFDSGDLAAKATYTFRAAAPGAITYVCTLHQGMTGTIRVIR
jgi:plastocyanin